MLAPIIPMMFKIVNCPHIVLFFTFPPIKEEKIIFIFLFIMFFTLMLIRSPLSTQCTARKYPITRGLDLGWTEVEKEGTAGPDPGFLEIGFKFTKGCQFL